jgi:hypothetical protein
MCCERVKLRRNNSRRRREFVVQNYVVRVYCDDYLANVIDVSAAQKNRFNSLMFYRVIVTVSIGMSYFMHVATRGDRRSVPSPHKYHVYARFVDKASPE